ncbi:hypothetical protein BV25DRAFT_1354335 [Artomyces pyxidatus]|uniref:Uncharacterized protein n=1 Tax=Artomyces pyxidatus TaxID=48021 RepID=A0ACB8SPM1_9AGAM|nr:hypothetical protein BV25DRAFT_1354335 [Artomyces pyxidatus]
MAGIDLRSPAKSIHQTGLCQRSSSCSRPPSSMISSVISICFLTIEFSDSECGFLVFGVLQVMYVDEGCEVRPVGQCRVLEFTHITLCSRMELEHEVRPIFPSRSAIDPLLRIRFHSLKSVGIDNRAQSARRCELTQLA